MSYKQLEIWQLAHELVLKIHNMTLDDLPGFEKYEIGSQIRRSMKSVKSNIVEGYGRRKYKNEFIKFLIYARASLMETTDHMETLYSTNSLKNELPYQSLIADLDVLGRKLNKFLQAVEKNHNK